MGKSRPWAELYHKQMVVKHAGAGNESNSLNTKNFKLQKSSDGSTWTDVDTVAGNISLVTDRNIPPFTDRFARLYITNGGSDGNGRIYEFELHGGSNMPGPAIMPSSHRD